MGKATCGLYIVQVTITGHSLFVQSLQGHPRGRGEGRSNKCMSKGVTQVGHTLSVANALNCTYGMVSLTDTLGGLEQVMVGPTSLT